MKSLPDAYRGYLWPFLTLMGGVGYDAARQTGGWHSASWPALFVGIFAALRSQHKIQADISGPNKCPRHRALQDRYDHGVGPAPHSWPADPDQPVPWTGDHS